MNRCPYGECTFAGSEAEVDDHVAYMTRLGADDPEHATDQLRGYGEAELPRSAESASTDARGISRREVE